LTICYAGGAVTFFAASHVSKVSAPAPSPAMTTLVSR